MAESRNRPHNKENDMRRILFCLLIAVVVCAESNAARRRFFPRRNRYGYTPLMLWHIDRAGDCSIFGDPFYR